MSDFENEKNAFNWWYNHNNDDSWFFVNNTQSLDKTKPILFGFYGGYHFRDVEIAQLQAEIDEIETAINAVISSCSNPEEISGLFLKASQNKNESDDEDESDG